MLAELFIKIQDKVFTFILRISVLVTILAFQSLQVRSQNCEEDLVIIDSTSVNCPNGYVLLGMSNVFVKQGSILRDTCSQKEDGFVQFIPAPSDICQIEINSEYHKKCYRQYSGIINGEKELVVVKYLNKRLIDTYSSWKYKHCIVYPHLPRRKQIVLDIRYFDRKSFLEVGPPPFIAKKPY